MENKLNTASYKEIADKSLMYTYNRYPVVMERGEGIYLYDVEGKKYLDFGSGIAVFAFGYANRYYNDALKAQVDKLIHTSNYFYNSPAAIAAERLTKIAGMDKVFFTNSGTEAIEGAIKLAGKYGFLKDGSKDHEIIAMMHSFHGRSTGALSVTGNMKYQEAFPVIGGVKFAEYNNIDSVKAALTDKTCAIILETVQGEGGVYPAEKEFLEEIRNLCDEHDLVMILDEIQCGMGRTGEMFAFESYGVKPDVMTVAKALGCGIPVGAFLARGKFANVLVPGDHGTTYGGNPLACAAVNAVLDLFEQSDILGNVKRVGSYLEKKLDELIAEEELAESRRGVGLMQGLVFEDELPVGKVAATAVKNGLIAFTAGGNVLRFVPPLIITEQDVDDMMVILRKSIADAKE